MKMPVTKRKMIRVKQEEDRFKNIMGRKWSGIVAAFLNRQEKNNIRLPLTDSLRFNELEV